MHLEPEWVLHEKNNGEPKPLNCPEFMGTLLQRSEQVVPLESDFVREMVQNIQ